MSITGVGVGGEKISDEIDACVEPGSSGKRERDLFTFR